MRGIRLFRTPFSFVLLFPALLAGCMEDGPLEPEALPGAEALESELAFGRHHSGRDATVLTRNLYLGGDISPLLGATDPLVAAGEIWAQIQHSNYPARAARLAREIANLSPDLVGLQEAVRFTVGPYPSATFPEGELIDFIEVLRANLAALGQDYTVAAYQPNTQVAMPLMLNGSLVSIGFQDAVAILVRSGVETANGEGHRFTATPPTSLTAGIPFLRGWAQVDARVGGGWVRFVSAHLEVQSFAPIQTAQATELVAALDNSPHPVILVGDFNSAANASAPPESRTASYDILRGAGFVDLWARTHRANTGLTCCHAADLSNTTPSFDQRLDLIMGRNTRGRHCGFAGRVRMELVGASRRDRFTVPEGYSLWPSDHAGVAATLRLPPGHFSRR